MVLARVILIGGKVIKGLERQPALAAFWRAQEVSMTNIRRLRKRIPAFL